MICRKNYFYVQWNIPANIRLDEDVLKTSFVFIFRRRFQDVFIKTNIFVLIIRLDHTSSRSLQDVLKTSSRRLAKTSCKSVFKISSRRLQDVLKTSSRRLAKMPSRCWRIIRLNYLTRSRICLGDTSEKFMVSVENVISVNVTPLL